MKKHLLGIAAAIAAAGLISLFTARRIEAQYSSPVKVVNSTSGPAIASVMDDRGRIPYQAIVNTPVSQCGGSNYCYINFPAVPAGHRLVITQIAGLYFFDQTGTPQFDITFQSLAPGGFQTGWTPPTHFNSSSIFNYPLTFYVDANQSFRMAAEVFGETFSSQLSQQVTVTGYLLDCNAAPCSAIAP